MKYLCLLYFDEHELYSLPKHDMDRLIDDQLAFDRDVTGSGHLLNTNPLEPAKASATVRVRDGRISTTDGPFAETKEQICGYYLIDARDLNEAIRVAAKMPAAKLGTIEVRPVRDVRKWSEW